jgi:hypothetical protein
MNVFLAGIIQGSMVEADIHSQDWRGPIKAALAEHCPSAEVYCHYSRHPDSISYKMPEIRATLDDGIRRAAASDLVVAYCPSASMGTAIEIYEAYRNDAVVLSITPLQANWVLRSYSDEMFTATEEFVEFLASQAFVELYGRKRGASPHE